MVNSTLIIALSHITQEMEILFYYSINRHRFIILELTIHLLRKELQHSMTNTHTEIVFKHAKLNDRLNEQKK